MLKKIALFCVILLGFSSNVYAQRYCGKDDMERVKNIANNIKITYEYRNDLEYKGLFDVVIEGMSEELVIREKNLNYNLAYGSVKNGIITLEEISGGELKFEIYYEKCSKDPIKVYDLKIPVYNYLSQNDICKGIDTDKVKECSEWYQGDLTEEELKQVVDDYNNKINGDQEQTDNVNKIINFLKENYIYIVSAFIVIGISIFVIVVKQKRAKLD